MALEESPRGPPERVIAPEGQAFLRLLEVTASANEPLFVGRQAYDGGTLVVGLTVRP